MASSLGIEGGWRSVLLILAIVKMLSNVACCGEVGRASGSITNQPGESLVLLKSGESKIISYGLYCVVSSSRSGSNAPVGGDLVLIIRNNGARWIDLQGVTVADFSLKDAQGNEIKLNLWTSPRGMAYGDTDVIHVVASLSASPPQPWTFRFKSKPEAFVPLDLLITGIEPRTAESKK
jgi:hypothetical protein